MPGRRIPVKLDLEALPYINEAGRVLPVTKAVDREMSALDREVDKVDRSMAELAATTAVAKREVDDLGDKSRGSAADLAALNARIMATKVAVRELGREFARTGDTGLFRDIRAGERDLRRMEKILSTIAGDANEVGVQAGRSVAASAQGGLSTPGLGPILVGILVGAAAAAAPTIGAMLGGAIAGAAGTGAMAAGIFAASKDQRVRDAASAFGQNISAQFFASGDAFVQPVINALGILQKGFGDLHLGDELAKVAPDVEVIAQGFADAGREFMEGFGPALDRMGPLAKVGADYITDFGEALGEALDNITRSKGTVEGLETLLAVITGTIRGLGVALEWLGNGFHRFNRLEAEVFGGLEDIYKSVGLDKFSAGAARLNDIFERLTGTGANLHGVLSRIDHAQLAMNRDLDPFAGYLEHATHAAFEFAGALSEVFKGQLDIDGATLAWKQDILALTESVKEHGHSLADNTEEGLRNRQMIGGLVRDAMAIREATLEQTGSVDQANAAYMNQIRILEALLVKLGFTKAQIQALVGNYEINVRVNYIATGSLAQILKNLRLEDRLTPHAAGGPLVPGVPYLFGEQGPEIGVFGQSGRMYSNTESMAMAQQWNSPAATGALPPVNITVQLVDSLTGRVTRQQLITDALNRGQPGSVVAAAYP